MSAKNKILVAVTNDVSSDQRVHKVCHYLVSRGFEVLVFGRVLPTTFQVNRPYTIIRKKLWFNSNFLFYAEYNLRLLFFLLSHKSTFILANDLDTLPACYVASKLKNTKLVYDSHELFTEVPELQGRKFVQKFWKLIEQFIVPKLKRGYTVSGSISDFYYKKYKLKMGVIKNVPYNNASPQEGVEVFPTSNKVLLYQGTLTENRGLKQAMLALNFLEDVDIVIIGYGKVEDELVAFAQLHKLQNRVHFLGRIDHDKLSQYTRNADIGLLLEEPIGLSFKYALPNKLFDYIHSELPILATPLEEVRHMITTHNIGVLVENHEPIHIAEKIQYMLKDAALLEEIKRNQRSIKEKYSWQNEQQKLDVYFS